MNKSRVLYVFYYTYKESEKAIKRSMMKKVNLKDPRDVTEKIIAERQSKLQDLLVLGGGDEAAKMTRGRAVEEVMKEFQEDEVFNDIFNNPEIKNELQSHATAVVERLNDLSFASTTTAVNNIAKGNDKDNAIGAYRETMSKPAENNNKTIEALSSDLPDASIDDKLEFLKAQVSATLYEANAAVTEKLADELNDVNEVKDTADAQKWSQKNFRQADRDTKKMMDREFAQALPNENPSENYVDRVQMQRGIVRQNFRRKIDISLTSVSEAINSDKDVLYQTLQAQTMENAFVKNDQLIHTQLNNNLNDLNKQKRWSLEDKVQKVEETAVDRSHISGFGSKEEPKIKEKKVRKPRRRFSFSRRRSSTQDVGSRRSSLSSDDDTMKWKDENKTEEKVKYVNPRNPNVTIGLKLKIEKAKEKVKEQESKLEKDTGGLKLGSSEDN